MLSMTTDFQSDKGCPQPALLAIARAGFSQVHWCHHWNDDFLYGRAEIDQIAAWLREYRLSVCDLHASAGVEKTWVSTSEYERQAGVELVANRIEMTARLGSDVIILHQPLPAVDHDRFAAHWQAACRSLGELGPIARKIGVRIAMENGNYAVLERLLAAFEPDFVGVCYDCGHGNINGGLDWLEKFNHRLISIHLHDNDGRSDQHRMPLAGSVDWPRLAGLIAASAYRKAVNCEAVMKNDGIADPAQWLAAAHAACAKFGQMLEEARQV